MDFSLERFSFGRGLTIATLAAFAAGIVVGTLLPETGDGALRGIAAAVEALGSAWVRALRMTVLPLVVGLLVVAVIDSQKQAGLAKLGGAAIGVFFSIYLVTAIVVWFLFPPLIRAFGVARGAVSSLPVEPVGETPAAAGDVRVADWIVQSIPVNPFAAAAEENILQVVLFSIVFAVAVGRLGAGSRASVTALFSPLAEAMLVVVAWLLRASPVAVFALSFGAAREIGFEAGRVLLAFALMANAVMLLLVLALVPTAGVLGRVGTARFARAAWPGQLVGLATRSSLAALPALVEGARSALRLPSGVIGFGLPLAAATFKPNALVSVPGKLLFLVWIFDLPLDLPGYVLFVGFTMLLASTTLGVPNQGGRVTALPAYLALGIPIEGVILLEAVDLLWDHAATVLNATGYLAATTLLPRGAEAVEAVAEAAAAGEAAVRPAG